MNRKPKLDLASPGALGEGQERFGRESQSWDMEVCCVSLWGMALREKAEISLK